MHAASTTPSVFDAAGRPPLSFGNNVALGRKPKRVRAIIHEKEIRCTKREARLYIYIHARHKVAGRVAGTLMPVCVRIYLYINLLRSGKTLTIEPSREVFRSREKATKVAYNESEWGTRLEREKIAKRSLDESLSLPWHCTTRREPRVLFLARHKRESASPSSRTVAGGGGKKGASTRGGRGEVAEQRGGDRSRSSVSGKRRGQ